MEHNTCYEIFLNAKDKINSNIPDYNSALEELNKIDERSVTMCIEHMKIICLFMLKKNEDIIEYYYTHKEDVNVYCAKNEEFRKLMAAAFFTFGMRKKAKDFYDISPQYEISSFFVNCQMQPRKIDCSQVNDISFQYLSEYKKPLPIQTNEERRLSGINNNKPDYVNDRNIKKSKTQTEYKDGFTNISHKLSGEINVNPLNQTQINGKRDLFNSNQTKSEPIKEEPITNENEKNDKEESIDANNSNNMVINNGDDIAEYNENEENRQKSSVREKGSNNDNEKNNEEFIDMDKDTEKERKNKNDSEKDSSFNDNKSQAGEIKRVLSNVTIPKPRSEREYNLSGFNQVHKRSSDKNQTIDDKNQKKNEPSPLEKERKSLKNIREVTENTDDNDIKILNNTDENASEEIKHAKTLNLKTNTTNNSQHFEQYKNPESLRSHNMKTSNKLGEIKEANHENEYNQDMNDETIKKKKTNEVPADPATKQPDKDEQKDLTLYEDRIQYKERMILNKPEIQATEMEEEIQNPFNGVSEILPKETLDKQITQQRKDDNTNQINGKDIIEQHGIPNLINDKESVHSKKLDNFLLNQEEGSQTGKKEESNKEEPTNLVENPLIESEVKVKDEDNNQNQKQEEKESQSNNHDEFKVNDLDISEHKSVKDNEVLNTKQDEDNKANSNENIVPLSLSDKVDKKTESEGIEPPVFEGIQTNNSEFEIIENNKVNMIQNEQVASEEREIKTEEPKEENNQNELPEKRSSKVNEEFIPKDNNDNKESNVNQTETNRDKDETKKDEETLKETIQEFKEEPKENDSDNVQNFNKIAYNLDQEIEQNYQKLKDEEEKKKDDDDEFKKDDDNDEFKRDDDNDEFKRDEVKEVGNAEVNEVKDGEVKEVKDNEIKADKDDEFKRSENDEFKRSENDEFKRSKDEKGKDLIDNKIEVDNQKQEENIEIKEGETIEEKDQNIETMNKNKEPTVESTQKQDGMTDDDKDQTKDKKEDQQVEKTKDNDIIIKRDDIKANTVTNNFKVNEKLDGEGSIKEPNINNQLSKERKTEKIEEDNGQTDKENEEPKEGEDINIIPQNIAPTNKEVKNTVEESKEVKVTDNAINEKPYIEDEDDNQAIIKQISINPFQVNENNDSTIKDQTPNGQIGIEPSVEKNGNPFKENNAINPPDTNNNQMITTKEEAALNPSNDTVNQDNMVFRTPVNKSSNNSTNQQIKKVQSNDPVFISNVKVVKEITKAKTVTNSVIESNPKIKLEKFNFNLENVAKILPKSKTNIVSLKLPSKSPLKSNTIDSNNSKK